MSLTKLALIGSCLFSSGVLAQTATSSSWLSEYTISAENITAKFIPYGARITSLTIPDRNGTLTDVVLGYDNVTQYPVDTATNHTYFGPVVGRYANRIKNGTFTLDGNTYQIPENENGGEDTLHGGIVGYDARNWTVTSATNNSITFTLLDDSFENFPGTVITHASFAVSSETLGSPWGIAHPRLTAKTVAIALDTATPIMLANHIYWNLNAFTAQTILNDTTLYMPYSKRYIQTDPILIPNGTLATVTGRPLDFTTPKLFGDAVPNALGYCGNNCTGIDNAFILDRPRGSSYTDSTSPVLSLWSENTGIRMDVATNQIGLQIYTCNGQNGTIPVKPSVIQRNQNLGINGATEVQQHGCLVIETQAYIDGINHPEWGNTDYWVYSPTTGSDENYATYDFTTF